MAHHVHDVTLEPKNYTTPRDVTSVRPRLNEFGRSLIVERVLRHGRPVSHVAKELGVSRQCAHRWIARFRAEGEAGLQDRSSRPHHSPTRTPVEVEQRVLDLRRTERRGQDWIGPKLGIPPRTVGAILHRNSVPRLSDCDPLTGEVIRASKVTAIRYERGRPGELVHMDVKKLGRIPDGGGWRALGRGAGDNRDRKHGTGFDYVHSLVDDHSRLAYSEILPDEKGATCVGFLERALDFFALKPHCPWQNGKVERFNRTLQTEWAYRQVFTSNAERAAALAPWLDFYNTQRRHSALAGLPPISRLSPTS